MPRKRAKTTVPSSSEYIQLAHGWKFCNKCDGSWQRSDHLRRHLGSDQHITAALKARNRPDLLYPVPDVVTAVACTRSYGLPPRGQGAAVTEPSAEDVAEGLPVLHAHTDHLDLPQHDESQDGPNVGPDLPQLPEHLGDGLDDRNEDVPLSWEVACDAPNQPEVADAWDIADGVDVYAVRSSG